MAGLFYQAAAMAQEAAQLLRVVFFMIGFSEIIETQTDFLLTKRRLHTWGVRREGGKPERVTRLLRTSEAVRSPCTREDCKGREG